MGEEKPHALGKSRMLREEALNEGDKCAGAHARRQHGLGVLAAERVSGTILECTCEEAAMHVEDSCGNRMFSARPGLR